MQAEANSPAHAVDAILRAAEANARTSAGARLDGGSTIRMPYPTEKDEQP
jgi:hypothetical protein